MSLSKIDRIKTHVPNYFRPTINRVWGAILNAFGYSDDNIVGQMVEAKDQTYIQTADGKYLDVLGANLSVFRPISAPISDDSFRQLIPILSYYPKQIRPTIYDALEVFWGENSTRANIISANDESYNLSGGETLSFIVDRNIIVDIEFETSDFEIPGAATAQEVADAITLKSNNQVIGDILKDVISNTNIVIIRTDTRGQIGSIQVTGGTAAPIVGFDTSIVENTEIALYEINHKELIVKIPHTLPLLFNSLKGSHHFHETTAEIYDGSPPTAIDPYWPGSFIYDTINSTFNITSSKAILNEILQSDAIYYSIEIIDSSQIPNSQGYLVFNYGNPKQEGPIPYLSRPNNTSILLDPSYVLQKTHANGDEIHYVTKPAEIPRIGGEDYPVFITDTSNTEALAIEIIKKIIAAGITIRFIVLDPTYKYETTIFL